MVCSEGDDSSNDNLLPEEIVVHEEWNAHGERAASKAKKGVGDSQWWYWVCRFAMFRLLLYACKGHE